MSAPFSLWVYIAVAALIAIVAFGIGQVMPGLGVAFVVAASTGWTAWNANRTRRIKQNG